MVNAIFCSFIQSRHFSNMKNVNHICFKERDTACCLREDQAGCVQTQKSECKGAEGHNPPRTETLGGTHKWVNYLVFHQQNLSSFVLNVMINTVLNFSEDSGWK